MTLVAHAEFPVAMHDSRRVSLALSVLLHLALLIAALWLLRPTTQPAPSTELESVSVSLITMQTASDGTITTESDATQSAVAAGAVSPSVHETEAVTETESTQPVEPAIPPMTAVAPTQAVSPDDHVVSAPQAIAAERLDPVDPPAIDTMPAAAPADIASQAAIAPPLIAVEQAQDAGTTPLQPASAEQASIEPTVAVPTASAVESLQPTPVTARIPASSEQPQPAEKVAAVQDASPTLAVTQPTPPKPDPPKPTPARRKPAASGHGGSSDADAPASASKFGGSGQVAAGGNAGQSQYPGLVQAQLRRALRFPAGASGAGGRALVRFLVHADGSVTDIEVVASAGYAVLDDAAVATIRRAAPFPPIPASANRPSWSFTLPLTFRR